jgi:Fe2+ transport system protein FeoA
LPWVKSDEKYPVSSLETQSQLVYGVLAVSKKPHLVVREWKDCPHPDVCPLAHCLAGTSARIKRLSLTPEVAERLREMGVFEEQEVRLVLKGNNLICKVCNARVGISKRLAEQILVKPLNGAGKAAS